MKHTTLRYAAPRQLLNGLLATLHLIFAHRSEVHAAGWCILVVEPLEACMPLGFSGASSDKVLKAYRGFIGNRRSILRVPFTPQGYLSSCRGGNIVSSHALALFLEASFSASSDNVLDSYK